MSLTLAKVQAAKRSAISRGGEAKYLSLNPRDAEGLQFINAVGYVEGMRLVVTEEVPQGQAYITDFNLLDTQRQAIRPAQAYGLGLACSAVGHHSPETPAAPDRSSPLGCGDNREGLPTLAGAKNLPPSEGATPLLTGHNNAV